MRKFLHRNAGLALVLALLLASLACSRDPLTATGAASTPSSSASSAETVAPAATATPAPAVSTVDTAAAREAGTAASIDADQQAALDVLHAYYRAIDAREFEKAYRFWGSHGAPDQTLETFAAGFADTATTNVETKTPSGIGAAAGSRYIEIPVEVTATTRNGEVQRFEGTYTLRRTVVDGAPEADRAWHIDHASLRAIASPKAR